MTTAQVDIKWSISTCIKRYDIDQVNVYVRGRAILSKLHVLLGERERERGGGGVFFLLGKVFSVSAISDEVTQGMWSTVWVASSKKESQKWDYRFAQSGIDSDICS